MYIVSVVLASVKQSMSNLCGDTGSDNLDLKEYTCSIKTSSCAAKRRRLFNSDDYLQNRSHLSYILSLSHKKPL